VPRLPGETAAPVLVASVYVGPPEAEWAAGAEETGGGPFREMLRTAVGRLGPGPALDAVEKLEEALPGPIQVKGCRRDGLHWECRPV
jgi:hypothetical protein